MQSLFRNSSYSLIFIVVSGMLVGCGGDPGTERPDRTPVSGSVSFAGVPVAGAIVVFSPVTTGVGKGATGITDDSGNFVLGTFEKNDGAVPGDYDVLVSKLEDETAADPADSIGEDDPAYDGGPAADAPEAEAKNLIPASFGKKGSSGLTATVGADPVEGLKFDLGG